ncbi:hypothetical protein [Nocardia brasiliensis]|uniref:hypothetical protein n=1 Tax=Nocardia brasiliensis TaxID=37326 RepID=UPI0033DCDE82
MTEFLFPDNTVLCNFAVVHQLHLLKSVLNGRGQWTGAVAYEAQRSSQSLPDLAALISEGWMSEPIEIAADADIQRVQRLRRVVFGGTDDSPLKHLGEAETCFVISEWPAYAGSWWISDDREALRYARGRGIITRETIDLMGIAVANGELTAQSAYDAMVSMIVSGRYLRMPKTAQELRL